MSTENRKRQISLRFRVTQEEYDAIKEKMVLSHITNLEAYLRKMAVDGVVVRLSLPELREMISLLRYMSNNINQIAKRLNETGRAYDSDFEDIQKRQDELWVKANEIITKLAEL